MRQAEQAIEIDVRGNVRGESIERVLDESIVRDNGSSRAEPRQPGCALAVVAEQPMQIRPGDAAIGGDRAFRRAVRTMRKRTGAILSRRRAGMHLVTGERDSVRGVA